MKFFHVYNDQYFAGLEKNGLINEDTGFKIQHVFSMPEDMKFNRYAAVGSKLHCYMAENRFPFYVDRIAGGVTYQTYAFDKTLIAAWRRLLGEWFLGFQQHETAGNRQWDWQHVKDRMQGQPYPFDVETLKKKSLSGYAVTPDGQRLYQLIQGTPEEYVSLPFPDTFAGVLDDFRHLFRQRTEATDGMILPVDSYWLLTHMQDELGMENFMPEVGCQIPHMRIAVALARGMASAKNKKWGVYYECWRTIQPYIGATMPCFNREPGNEWYLTQETHRDDFTTYGPHGGSSRLLQKRIYYYGLMAGAKMMSEEWGLHCSYAEMKGDFPLSPYGQVKKDFIEFARGHKNVRARVPFAVVLPKECPYVDLTKCDTPIGARRTTGFKQPLTGDETDMFGCVEDVLKLIFQRDPATVCGTEGHVMQNSRFGDLFDVIYEDVPRAALEKYDLLIDTSAGGRMTRDNPTLPFVHYQAGRAEALAKVIENKAKELLPLTCDRLMWLLSEDEHGRYLSVFNNEGNERNLEWGDRILHAADGVTKITLREPMALSLLYASSPDVKLTQEGDRNYALFLPAAQFAILRMP